MVLRCAMGCEIPIYITLCQDNLDGRFDEAAIMHHRKA